MRELRDKHGKLARCGYIEDGGSEVILICFTL